jgi:hypothetical protein
MAIKKILKESSELENKASNYDNMIKIGTFQLQTRSFWIGLVSILVLFLLAVIWLNTYYWHNICNELIEANKIIMQKNL